MSDNKRTEMPQGLALNPQIEWRRKIDEGARGLNGTQVWLISFTDLFSILLCFFVMMYSMKDPDVERIAQISGRGSGGYVGDAKQAAGDREGTNIQRVEYDEGIDLSYLKSALDRSMADADLQDEVDIRDMGRYLSLRLRGDGRDDVVRALGGALSGISNTVKVVGVPSGARLGDWDAALSAAGRFADRLKAGGYKRQLVVTGVGHNADARGAAYVELHIEGYAEN